jgi:AcrR family transcriptional regulator
VRRTKASLHDALIGLAREKPYPSIAVKEILERANVGKSTFYTHFRDKDDLLESGIHEILRSVEGQPRTARTFERILDFSLPLLTHIDEHRRAAGPRMPRLGRVAMHTRLEAVLRSFVAEQLRNAAPCPPVSGIPTDLAARHLAATFVLVLNWWVESEAPLTPREVDGRFRALVMHLVAERG